MISSPWCRPSNGPIRWSAWWVARRPSAGQVASGLVEAACDGAVDDLVTDLDVDAAHDRLVDDDLQQHGRAVGALQGGGEPGALLLAEVTGGGDDGSELLATLRGDVEVLLDGAVEAASARGEHRLPGQGDGLLLRLALQQPGDELGLAVGVARTVAQRVTQRGVAGDDPLEAEELVLDLLDRACLLRPLQQGLDGEPLDGVGEVALARPPLGHHRGDDGDRVLAHLATEEPGDQLALAGALPGRVDEGATQGRLLVEQPGDGEEVLGQRSRTAVGEGRLESGAALEDGVTGGSLHQASPVGVGAALPTFSGWT